MANNYRRRVHNLITIIQKTAQDKGLPIKSEFPAWDDFTRFIAALPQKAQVQWLLYQLDFLEKPYPQVWSDEWETGNVSSFESKEREMHTLYPELYAIIGPARNQKWVDRIEQMLKEPGIHFIQVGLFHTLGPESIQTQLERRGIHCQRM